MRSFLEVSGLCSKSPFVVIEGIRLWPQIRKEILILLNLWTILHKLVEFLVCQQRRNLHNIEDFWVISGRSRMVSPFQELLSRLRSPFNRVLLVPKQSKPQAHLHGMPPLITTPTSKGKSEHLDVCPPKESCCSPTSSNTAVSSNKEISSLCRALSLVVEPWNFE